MVAYWSNEDSKITSFDLQGIDLDDNNNYIDCGMLPVKRINSLASSFYDKRTFDNDTDDGIVASLKGDEIQKGKSYRVKPIFNQNIVAYMVVMQSGFDNPDLNSGLTTVGRYVGTVCMSLINSFKHIVAVMTAKH